MAAVQVDAVDSYAAGGPTRAPCCPGTGPGLQLVRTQHLPAVAAAGAARVTARQRGWGGWGLLPGGQR